MAVQVPTILPHNVSLWYFDWFRYYNAISTVPLKPQMEQVVACALVTQRARVRSPVGTSFLGEVFRGFSSPVRQMSGSFRPQVPRISFGHHYHPYSFITGANNLRCWRTLKPQIYIHQTSDIVLEHVKIWWWHYNTEIDRNIKRNTYSMCWNSWDLKIYFKDFTF